MTWLGLGRLMVPEADVLQDPKLKCCVCASSGQEGQDGHLALALHPRMLSPKPETTHLKAYSPSQGEGWALGDGSGAALQNARRPGVAQRVQPRRLHQRLRHFELQQGRWMGFLVACGFSG